MNEPNLSASPDFTPPAPRSYEKTESIYAWVCVLAGYLLCRLVPVTAVPLGAVLFLFALYAVTLIILRRKGYSCPKAAWCAVGSALVIGSAMLFCAEPFLRSLCFWYALVAYAYTVHATATNTLSRGLSDFVWIDTFKAALIMPFCARANIFTAMFSGKAKVGGKVLAKILGGLLIALVPTAVVLGLLSYDSGFSELLQKLLDFNIGDIVSHLASIVFGIPVGMYLFGMLIAGVDHEGGHILTEEHCRTAAEKCRVVSTLTVTAATVPMLLVYIVFFVSQWHYYVAGFTGELPDGFSYASFAREGFFQLCAVSVINLGMILLAIAVTKRNSNGSSVLLKILTPLYSVSTLVLIATAVAKMVMYIDAYGLTQKRVYATWFMAVLAVVFVLIAIGRFVPTMKTVFLCTAVCVTMFAGLSLANVNGIIADYNVDCYLSGDLKTVDLDALEDLDEAAVPALCRLYTAQVDSGKTTGTKYYRCKQILEEQASVLQEHDLWAFSIPQARAVAALKGVGMWE